MYIDSDNVNDDPCVTDRVQLFRIRSIRRSVSQPVFLFLVTSLVLSNYRGR